MRLFSETAYCVNANYKNDNKDCIFFEMSDKRKKQGGFLS